MAKNKSFALRAVCCVFVFHISFPLPWTWSEMFAIILRRIRSGHGKRPLKYLVIALAMLVNKNKATNPTRLDQIRLRVWKNYSSSISLASLASSIKDSKNSFKNIAQILSLSSQLYNRRLKEMCRTTVDRARRNVTKTKSLKWTVRSAYCEISREFPLMAIARMILLFFRNCPCPRDCRQLFGVRKNDRKIIQNTRIHRTISWITRLMQIFHF